MSSMWKKEHDYSGGMLLQTKVKHENKSELNGVLLLTKKTVVNKLIINTAPKTNQIPQSKSIHFTNTYYILEMKQQVRN